MGSQFNDTQIGLIRYFYEKLPYTSYYSSLTSGGTTVNQVRDASSANKHGEFMSITSDIAVTQNTGVDILLYGAANNINNSTDAYPPNLSTTMNHKDAGIRSTKSSSITLQNNTGASISGFQVNYCGAGKKLSVADKVLRGLPIQDSFEQMLQNKFRIQGQGLRPLSVSRMLDQVFMSQILDNVSYAQSLSSVTSSVQTVFNLQAAHNTVLVVRSIASQATIGNLVSINIARDNQDNYVSILADNMSLDNPIPVWIPVMNSLSLTMSAVTTTANVPVYLSVYHIKLSTVIKALFGMLNYNSLSGEDKTLYEQVLAGVIA